MGVGTRADVEPIFSKRSATRFRRSTSRSSSSATTSAGGASSPRRSSSTQPMMRRERRAQLVGRLARHADPQARLLAAPHVREAEVADEHEQAHDGQLHEREEADQPRQRALAVVDALHLPGAGPQRDRRVDEPHLVHECGEGFGVRLGRRGHVARARDGPRRRVDEHGRDREARRTDDLVEHEAQAGVGRRVGGPLDGLGQPRAVGLGQAGGRGERVERVPRGPVARGRRGCTARAPGTRWPAPTARPPPRPAPRAGPRAGS